MADNRIHEISPGSGLEGALAVDNADVRLDGSTPELKNLQELTHFVQTLLQQMQDKFQAMSDQVLSRIDEMGTRIEDLERNIGDLMTQAGVEGGSSTTK